MANDSMANCEQNLHTVEAEPVVLSQQNLQIAPKEIIMERYSTRWKRTARYASAQVTPDTPLSTRKKAFIDSLGSSEDIQDGNSPKCSKMQDQIALSIQNLADVAQQPCHEP